MGYSRKTVRRGHVGKGPDRIPPRENNQGGGEDLISAELEGLSLEEMRRYVVAYIGEEALKVAINEDESLWNCVHVEYHKRSQLNQDYPLWSYIIDSDRVWVVSGENYARKIAELYKALRLEEKAQRDG